MIRVSATTRVGHHFLTLFAAVSLAACDNRALRGSSSSSSSGSSSSSAQGAAPPAPAVLTKASKWEWRVFTQDMELMLKHGWSDQRFQTGHESNGERVDVYAVSVGNDAGVKQRGDGANAGSGFVEVKALLDVRPSRNYYKYQKTTGQTLSSAKALCGHDASGRPKFEPFTAVDVSTNKTTGKLVFPNDGSKENRVTLEQQIVKVDGQRDWFSISFVGRTLSQVEADVTHHFGLTEDWNVTTLGDEGFFVGGFPEFLSMLVQRSQLQSIRSQWPFSVSLE